ncbi:MAG TPA: hypothetical protein VNF50_06880 [Acidimicrobiales bacterium]|nr:hypothetical protein [Acidimicrobiales bacterium]
MSRFEEQIEAARRAASSRPQSLGTSPLDVGPAVQLSVRLPATLRAAVASTAAVQSMTVTAFVTHALRLAISEANDSFVGLAAELSRNLRAELRSAIEDGTYREASAKVEREESWS